MSQGRYRWRHDKVLQSLASILETERKKPRPKATTQSVNFVKAGENINRKKRDAGSFFNAAQIWEMRVDLGSKLIFPEIVQTTLRPDIVVWSPVAKSIIMIELTVPWEEGCEEAHERKLSKYEELAETCRQKGWKTQLYAVEVGCRGFPARSVGRFLKDSGIVGKTTPNSH